MIISEISGIRTNFHRGIIEASYNMRGKKLIEMRKGK